MKTRIKAILLILLLISSIVLPFVNTNKAKAYFANNSDVASGNSVVIDDGGTLTFTPESGGAFNLTSTGNLYSGNATSQIVDKNTGENKNAFWVKESFGAGFGCWNSGVRFRVFNFTDNYTKTNLENDLTDADNASSNGSGSLNKVDELVRSGSLSGPDDNRLAGWGLLYCQNIVGEENSSTSTYNSAIFEITKVSTPGGGGAPTPTTPPSTQPTTDVWYDSAGNAVTSYGSGRFKFNSPMEMLDTKTNTYYMATGYPKMFEGDDDNNSLFDDGAAWFRPMQSDKKTLLIKSRDNTKCLGIVAASFVSGSDDNKYGKVHFLPPKPDAGGTCKLDEAPITGLTGFTTGADSNTIWKFISDSQDKYNHVEDFYSLNIAPLMASHYWANKDSIRVVGRDISLKRVSASSESDRYNILTNKLGLDENAKKNYEFWTTDSCLSGKNATDAFSVLYFKKETSGSSVTSQISLFNYNYAKFLMAKTVSVSENEFGSKEFDSTWNYDEGEGIKCLVGINTDQAPLRQAAYDQLHGRIDLLPLAYPSYATMTKEEVDQNGGIPGGLVGQPDGGDGNTVKSCEDNFPTFGIIVCGLFETVDAILGLVESTIQKTLEISPDKYSTVGGDNSLYFAWVNMARVSSVLLVIIALIMIAGTALGDYKMFSAYTVKKVLPRMVIAAVGIWLSWSIITTYIQAINTIGKGLADLLWSPFADSSGIVFADWGLADVFATKGASGLAEAGYAGFTVIGGMLGTAAVAYSVATGGAWALLSSLLPVVVFMLIGYVVLVLRQSIIIFLLVTAPIAIVSWVLPNTQKLVWGKWSKFLNQLLFMYPMFMGVLAAGKIFSYIIAQNNDTGLFVRFIPVIAYITPFVLLPGIFKSAGGALSKVTGSGLKLGTRATKGAKESLDARKSLSAGALAKAQRKNFRSQTAQADFARGLTKDGGRFTKLRQRGLGGLTSSQTARDAMLAGALGVAAGDKEKRIKDQTELLRHNELLGNRDELRRIANSTDPNDSIYKRQAALNRLVQIGDDEGIRGAAARYTGPDAKEEDKKAWSALTTSGEYAGAFKDKAPYMMPGREGMFDNAPSASYDAASSWNKATWDKAFSGSQGAQYKQLAREMLANTSAAGKVNTEVVKHLRDTYGVTAASGGPIVPPAGPTPSLSDIRLKKNISYLSTIKGHRIYKYQYIWSDEFYAGVMAQEVSRIIPDAVTEDATGYLRVDYSMLDMNLLTYEDWQKIHEDRK